MSAVAGGEKSGSDKPGRDRHDAQGVGADLGGADLDVSSPRGGYSDRAGFAERPKAGAMEVIVEHNVEKAMRILKRKLIKEGLFKELKARRFYEKPSERRKRKDKESKKKVRKEEARAKKNALLY